ncbi:MAG: hypothetical protein L6Q29_03005 [Candidatus Pacebacteria bacterium]|nr:hypothetical protein [Candidatus Paceibacterota bacterium]NUQ57193.1 hypothetical protein [Candidatus Paceibacter sp.]
MKSNNFFIKTFLSFAAAAAALGVWLFVLNYIENGKTDLAVQRGKLAENEERLAGLKSAMDSLNSFKKESDIIESVFLTEDEMIRVIEGLESISANSGVKLKINSVSADGAKNLKPSFSFSVDGPFESIIRYLYSLENLPYLINITRASIIKKGTSASADAGEEAVAGGWQGVFTIELESYEKS